MQQEKLSWLVKYQEAMHICQKSESNGVAVAKTASANLGQRVLWNQQ
jgi:hypothetical protein